MRGAVSWQRRAGVLDSREGHNESFVSAARVVDASRRLLRCQEASVHEAIVSGGVRCRSNAWNCHLSRLWLRGMLPPHESMRYVAVYLLTCFYTREVLLRSMLLQ